MTNIPLITLRIKKKASFVFNASVRVPPLRRTSDKVEVKPNPMISQKIKTVSAKVCVFIYTSVFVQSRCYRLVLRFAIDGLCKKFTIEFCDLQVIKKRPGRSIGLAPDHFLNTTFFVADNSCGRYCPAALPHHGVPGYGHHRNIDGGPPWNDCSFARTFF